MNAHTPGPWHAMHKLSPALSDHGYRVIAEVPRGNPRIHIYAEASRMLQEGRGYVWGQAEDDARLIAAAPELETAVAECAGMLSACIDIIAGRQRASGKAADEIGAQHRKCLALLRRIANGSAERASGV